MKIYHAVVGPIGTNCYVVVNEELKEGVIVDPGGDPDRILSMVKELDVKITAILVTHGHSDHIGGLRIVREATKAPVYIGEGDADCLPSPSRNLSFFIGDDCTNDPAEYEVKDGDIIETAGLKFKVLETPGHTAGGVCYYNEEGGFVLVGDTIFCESIGRTDLPGGSYAQILASIKSKLLTLGDEVKLLPGHGPGTNVGWERRRNPFLQG